MTLGLVFVQMSLMRVGRLGKKVDLTAGGNINQIDK